MITAQAFSGKSYAVLGLARSGAATVEALLASGARVVAWDRQDVARAPFVGRCELADPLEMDLTGFDGVVVSPGVPLNTHPIKPHAEKFGVPVIGDIELFAQARPELPPHKVVGITGTNGKSTTTALVHHILKTAGVPTTMGGNIGLPILAQDPLPEGGVYVLELSSYQIDLTFSLDCDVAVLLNITPDHLDRYDGSFEKYAASKARLFEMQSAQRLAVVEYAAEADLDVLDGASEQLSIQFIDKVDLPSGQKDWPSLQGPHNLQNTQAAVVACRALGLTDVVIGEGLRTFTGLPHRMERVATYNGVLFVNDSKATNTDSAAPALAAFPPDPAINNGAPRIHWIVGGLPKEDGLGATEAHLANVKAAYTIGEAGPRFAELLEGRVPVDRSEMVDAAVRRAMRVTVPGDVILLSPACASFDQFKDFERRGEHFRQIVAALTGASQDKQAAMAAGDNA
ncbi:UDP-N-acetylmuramoyl-L-alanine--D-glutamate ligase [Altererythrobacter sp. BO-6]|uniref:UDP-N-acetylmuramoyl-L-alanine--D-glutamate ligase n=1 Tax=Altererythrobacter sp. BO-6 TaxID=2604537 RepID=UPI0013E103E3|nr:UDP-N-acetylmuramoyl-L-alanine--D-glutamate ligase [Altererythrobacter sp. BO-6]QIG54893.1 UDP-N-acetylmuramoyl-L-alanine--D-glutamate ligase [Altererythrobacter sp. BO-6]